MASHESAWQLSSEQLTRGVGASEIMRFRPSEPVRSYPRWRLLPQVASYVIEDIGRAAP